MGAVLFAAIFAFDLSNLLFDFKSYLLGSSLKGYNENINMHTNVDLLICILSDHQGGATKIRQDARETWLSPLFDDFRYEKEYPNTSSILHFFVVGILDLSDDTVKRLVAEKEKYNDLILLPISDKYSGGGMLMKYLWLMQIALLDLNIQFKHLLRITHDTFVNLPLFMLNIKNYNSNFLLVGEIMRNSIISRDPNDNNGDLKYDVCKGDYHPYPNGYGWLISRGIADWLTHSFPLTKNGTTHAFPRILANDDVNFGLMMAILDIEWRQDDRFVSRYPDDSVVSSLGSSKVPDANFAHKYYQIYRDNLRAVLLSKELPQIPIIDTCSSKDDRLACDYAKYLVVHIHFTHDTVFKDSIRRLMGGCLCK